MRCPPEPTPTTMSTVLRAMAATVPAANPRLLACAGASFVLMVAFYYLVQFGFSVRGKTQTERQRSWVLTSLSRCAITVAPLEIVLISRQCDHDDG